MFRLAGESGFGLLLFGFVVGELGEALKIARLVVDRGGEDPGPEPRSVLPHPPTLGREAAVGGRGAQTPVGRARSGVLLGIEAREMLSEDFFGPIAHQALRARVPQDDAALPVEHEQGVVLDAGHQETKPAFAGG